MDACYVSHLSQAIQWLMHQMGEKLASNQLENTYENSKSKYKMETERTKKKKFTCRHIFTGSFTKNGPIKKFSFHFSLKNSESAVKNCFKIELFSDFQKKFHKNIWRRILNLVKLYARLLKLTLREKCPNTEFFLGRIFPHSDGIRRD